MPRPRSLSPTDVASAALRVIERDGLGALSMRAVADEIGVGTMSLYRYVRGRDEIEQLVVDLVLAGVDTEVSRRRAWQSTVTVLMTRVRDAVAEHPDIIPLVLTRRQDTEASIRWGEAMLAALDEGGLQGTDRVIAFRTLLSYLLGAVQVEHLGALSGPGTGALARLPTDRYPFLADTAAHARRITSEQEFRSGLRLVLRGLGG